MFYLMILLKDDWAKSFTIPTQNMPIIDYHCHLDPKKFTKTTISAI